MCVSKCVCVLMYRFLGVWYLIVASLGHIFLLLLTYASHFRPLGLVKKFCLEWSFEFCVSTICQVAKTLKQIIETQTRAKWLNL